MLPIQHAAEKRGSKEDWSVSRSYSSFEDGLEDRRGLDDVELCSVYQLTCRLEQPGLEKLNGCGDAEEQSERDARAPGT